MDYLIFALCALNTVLAIIVIILCFRAKKGTNSNYSEDIARLNEQLEKDMAEISGALKGVSYTMNQTVAENFKMLSENISRLTEGEREAGKQTNEYVHKFLDSLKADIDKRLSEMNASNTEKLEEMRKTVGEKLAESLDNRVKLAFDGVNTRLVEMQKGFDEVQKLSGQVTKLNGVFTNVKNRGTWGEVSLENILTEILPADLFEKQFRIPGTRDAVDFAIKMPAGGDELYLPIDAKFPLADYERLTEAYDSGDRELAVNARKRLLVAVKEQAKSISTKYIDPPKTTDFAIMYLPTEGVFAEVAREAGFIDELRVQYKIIPCGPTTISALLNSLTVGFTTLKIQKKSAEVVKLMKDFAKDFDKFTDLIEKIRRGSDSINTALEGLDKRNEIIRKKLGRLDLAEIPDDTLSGSDVGE